MLCLCVAWQLRAIDQLQLDLIAAAAPAAGMFTGENIIGALLAVPLDFFHDDLSKAPDVWGYVGKVIGKVRADKPAFSVQFHDGQTTFYLNPHPRFLETEKHRYLNSARVKIVSVATE